MRKVLRKVLTIGFRAALLLVVLAVAAWLLRGPLFGGRVKRELQDALADAVGGRYEIGDLGGNWITGIRILELRTVEAPPTGVLERIDADEIAVRYDLLGLLSDDPLAAIEDVRAHGVIVDLDPGRPSAPASQETPLELPETLRPTVVVDGSVRIASPEGPAVLAGVHIAFGPGVPVALDVKEVRLPDRFDVRGPWAGRIERVGETTWRWSSEAVLGGIRVPQATFTTGGTVAARVEVAGGVLEVTLDAGLVRMATDGIDLARLPPWLARHLPEAGPTAGRVRAEMSARLDALPALSFDLLATGLRVGDETISLAKAKGRWDGARTVVLESLVAGSPDADASLRDATLDLDLPWVVRDVRQLMLDVGNLRSLLPDLDRDVAVSVKAASTEPRRLEVEQILLQAGGGTRVEARGVLRLPADTKAWRETKVEGTLAGVVTDLAPLDVALEGRLDVSGTVGGTVTAPVLALEVDGEAAKVEGYEVGRAKLGGLLTGDGVDALRVDVQGPFGEVRGTGSIRFQPPAVVLEDASVEIADVRRLASRLLKDGPVLEGALDGEGRLQLDDETIVVAGRLVARDLRVDGELVGALDVRIRAEGARLLVEAVDVRGPWGEAQASGTVDPQAKKAVVDGLVFSDGDVHAFLRAPLELDWAQEGIAFTGVEARVDTATIAADGFVDPTGRIGRLSRLEVRAEDHSLWLEEPLEVVWTDGVVDLLRVDASIDDDIRVRASVRLDPERETAVVGDLEVRGPFGEARLLAPLRLAWRGDLLDVEGLDGVFEDVRALGGGSVDLAARRARLDSLFVTKGDTDLRLRAPAELQWTDEEVTIADLDVEVLGATVRGRATWRDEPVADLEIDGLALARLFDGPTGTLRGWVRLGDGAVTAQADVEDLAYESWRGKASVLLRQDRGEPLRVERLRIDGPEGGHLEGSAVIPYRMTPEGLAYRETVVPEFTLEGVLGGLDAFTDVADGPFRIKAHGKAGVIDGTIRVDDLVLCDAKSFCDDGLFHLHVERGGGSVRLALTNDEFAQVRGTLTFDRGFDWTRPGEIGAFLDEAHVEGEIAALVRDWKPLAAAEPDLKMLEGAARLDVRIRGPLRDPDVRGELVLEKFSLGLETDVAPFREVDARVVFGDRVVRIEQFEGLMGYAPFRIGGEIREPFGARPEFDLTLHGRNTQLLRTDWTRMRIDVDGTIKGAIDQLVVKGAGRIVDATFREPVSLASAGEAGESPEVVLFDIQDWPFSEMRFDLKVKADRSIRIRNNLVRVNVSFDGALQGTGNRPELVGRAWFENADIFLPLSTLRGGEGDIRFLPGMAFRPRIQMTARTRTRGYELGVQIAGTVPDVNLHVFSEPWLDDEDAILMLTTGSTSAELADGGILGKALSGVLTIFGGSLFSTRAGDGEPGGKAFFERFEFTTDWEGSNVTRIDGEIELTERFFLHLETDRFEATNVGLIWRIRFR